MKENQERTLQTAVIASSLIGLMLGLAFASVPLYRIFCQRTGFGGTPKVAPAYQGPVGKKEIIVRFNADVNPELPWDFEPLQRQISLRVGAPGLAIYRARNKSSQPLTGWAVFNVAPDRAGPYFAKVQCFCFDEQTIPPGAIRNFPVSFYIDPAIEEDRSLKNVKTITLSYTFFKFKGKPIF